MADTSYDVIPEAATAVHQPSGRAPRGFGGIAVFATLVVLAAIVLVPIYATIIDGF